MATISFLGLLLYYAGLIACQCEAPPPESSDITSSSIVAFSTSSPNLSTLTTSNAYLTSLSSLEHSRGSYISNPNVILPSNKSGISSPFATEIVISTTSTFQSGTAVSTTSIVSISATVSSASGIYKSNASSGFSKYTNHEIDSSTISAKSEMTAKSASTIKSHEINSSYLSITSSGTVVNPVSTIKTNEAVSVVISSNGSNTKKATSIVISSESLRSLTTKIMRSVTVDSQILSFEPSTTVSLVSAVWTGETPSLAITTSKSTGSIKFSTKQTSKVISERTTTKASKTSGLTLKTELNETSNSKLKSATSSSQNTSSKQTLASSLEKTSTTNADVTSSKKQTSTPIARKPLDCRLVKMSMKITNVKRTSDTDGFYEAYMTTEINSSYTNKRILGSLSVTVIPKNGAVSNFQPPSYRVTNGYGYYKSFNGTAHFIKQNSWSAHFDVEVQHHDSGDSITCKNLYSASAHFPPIVESSTTSSIKKIPSPTVKPKNPLDCKLIKMSLTVIKPVRASDLDGYIEANLHVSIKDARTLSLLKGKTEIDMKVSPLSLTEFKPSAIIVTEDSDYYGPFTGNAHFIKQNQWYATFVVTFTHYITGHSITCDNVLFASAKFPPLTRTTTSTEKKPSPTQIFDCNLIKMSLDFTKKERRSDTEAFFEANMGIEMKDARTHQLISGDTQIDISPVSGLTENFKPSSFFVSNGEAYYSGFSAIAHLTSGQNGWSSRFIVSFHHFNTGSVISCSNVLVAYTEFPPSTRTSSIIAPTHKPQLPEPGCKNIDAGWITSSVVRTGEKTMFVDGGFMFRWVNDNGQNYPPMPHFEPTYVDVIYDHQLYSQIPLSTFYVDKSLDIFPSYMAVEVPFMLTKEFMGYMDINIRNKYGEAIAYCPNSLVLHIFVD